jgi:TrkA domain protein
MTVYESDLPGVGKKFEVEIGDDHRLIIVTHNTGKREVFYKTSEAADAEKLFDLSDQLARRIGTILEGAYFQPVQADRVATMLAEGTFIEWYDVDPEAELVGQSLAEARVRERTGASVIAIHRGDRVVPSPDPDTVIEAGDTLVVLGSQEDVNQFEPLITGDGTEGA